MTWNHVVLEGFCSYENEVFENVPCCKTKPGFTSVLCLGYDNDNVRCSYFAYTRARSCIVLTDDNGDDISCATFWCDETNNDEYIKRENEWLSRWENLIKEDDAG